MTFDTWHLTLICHDISFTKKEKFARHLKKICKRFEIYTGTGSDGTCTGTDDTVMMVLALVLKVLTSLALMLMTLAQSHFHWWILRLSSISKKGLTHSPNNIGLRDASASKKRKPQIMQRLNVKTCPPGICQNPL